MIIVNGNTHIIKIAVTEWECFEMSKTKEVITYYTERAKATPWESMPTIGFTGLLAPSYRGLPSVLQTAYRRFYRLFLYSNTYPQTMSRKNIKTLKSKAVNIR